MYAEETATVATELIELEEQYGAHNYHPLNVIIERAAGAWVYDVEGKQYLDFLAAYSAVNQGHCHPAILKAMTEQAARVTITSRAFRNDQLPLLYRDLHEITGFEMALPMNSGVEAVETALKAARKWGETVKGVAAGQGEIIVCANNFHGRTISVVGFSSEEQYKTGFGPFAPGFKTVPFGNLEALRAAITPNTVGFLVEPVQGEGGFHVASTELLRRLRSLCDQHGMVLIADEIQSGFGRTGRWFAIEHSNINPDLITVAKSLAGGYPLSALIGKAEIMDAAAPGGLGGTYAGSPVAIAAAHAVIGVIKDEELNKRSSALGRQLISRLHALRIRVPQLAEVRGLGSMVAAEFCQGTGGGRSPDASFAKRIQQAALDAGLILLTCGASGNVIRFLYPLTIEDSVFDEGISIFERCAIAATH